jgi:iron(III) transport system substrate-binding protein
MLKPALIVTGLALATLAATSGCSVFSSDEKKADLQVYSARHYGSEEVFKQFTKETGITVKFISDDNAPLLERIKAEGKDSPADIYMTVDAGNLWHAAEEGILAPVQSAALARDVPKQYRDSQDRWFGLVLRARTVLYNTDDVKESEFDPNDTYAGLADPKWKGRLCMRDTSEAYTVSLVASLINLYGHDRALDIVKGWVANDVNVMANDKLLIQAVQAGTCDVALVNHYYVAREIDAGTDLDKTKLFWASQQGAGTHVNISGAGIVKTSDNKADAQKLLEWLAAPSGQAAMMAGNHEYPVNPAVEPDEVASTFGDFKPMPIDAEALGSRNAEAIDLLAEAEYR